MFGFHKTNCESRHPRHGEPRISLSTPSYQGTLCDERFGKDDGKRHLIREIEKRSKNSFTTIYERKLFRKRRDRRLFVLLQLLIYFPLTQINCFMRVEWRKWNGKWGQLKIIFRLSARISAIKDASAMHREVK